MLIAALFAGLAYADPLAVSEAVVFDRLSDPNIVRFADGQGVLVDYNRTPYAGASGWTSGLPLVYAYDDEHGARLTEPVSGTTFTVVGTLDGTPHLIDALEATCLATAYSTVDMSQCSSTALDRWERELDRGWATLLACGDADQRVAILRAQAAWHAHRATQFEVYSSFYDRMDGSIVGLLRGNARVELVRSEAKQLMALVADI